MADFPQISNYTIQEIISSDSIYTNYLAIPSNLDSDVEFIITEFNPSYMVRRSEDGVLEPIDRFVMEFEGAFDRFAKMADSLANLNEPFIAPIQEVLENNNTMYIVRVLGKRYRTLDESLGVESREFTSAYVLLRPLIQSLVTAYKKSLFFQFLPGSVGVNPYGQLVLDSMFAWEVNHKHMITEIVKLFYRLITGVEYDPGFPENPSLDGMGLPPHLTAIFKEVLVDEPIYGSIDDFGKALRRVMDREGKKEVLVERKEGDAEEASEDAIKKWVGVGIVAVVILAVVALVGVPLLLIVDPGLEETQYYADHYYAMYTGAEVPEYQYTLRAIDEYPAVVPMANFVRIHIGYAITDPNDPTIMLNGSFAEAGGWLYQRAYQGGFGLASGPAAGSLQMLVEGVRPAFIVPYGGYIYFSDGLSNYNIRRVRQDGSGLQTISDNSASFLALHGNSLFYTNHSNRDFLYRLDLANMTSSPVVRSASYEMLIHNGRLYFVNGSRNFNIYSVPVDQPEAEPVRFNSANSDNLRVSGRDIFYRDVDDNTISRVSLNWPVASFDVYGSIMAIIEMGNYRLWIYDLQDQSLHNTGEHATYAAVAHDGTIRFIRLDDSRVNGWYVPVVEVEPLYETLEENLEEEIE